MFYAIYASADASTTGCTHQFTTPGREDLGYPPQVQYRCLVCTRTHNFRLLRTVQATTPSQRRAFTDNCRSLGITDIDVVIDDT